MDDEEPQNLSETDPKILQGLTPQFDDLQSRAGDRAI